MCPTPLGSLPNTLPMAKWMGSFRARQSSGPFKTSGTEKWPAKMCQWIAAMSLATCTFSATSASKGSGEVQKTSAIGAQLATEEEAPFPTCPAEGGRLLGGSGPPRICKLVGGDKPFRDGGGLCSPGRWPRDRRELAEGRNWDWLRRSLFKTVSDFAGGPCDARERSLPDGYRRRRGLHLGQEQQATRGHPQDMERLDRGPGFGGRRIARKGPGQPLRLRLSLVTSCR